MYTPCLKINYSSIQNDLKRLQSLGNIFYPVKANPHPQLLKQLCNENILFNVSSLYYLKLIKNLGVPSSRILYDNCFSTLEELDLAINYGIKLFCVDSLKMFNYITSKSCESKYYIKMSNNLIDKLHYYKFGCNNIESLFFSIKEKNKLAGMSFYLGHELFNIDNLKNMTEIAIGLGEINSLNIGGGFSTHFLRTELENFVEYYKDNNCLSNICFEPGRALLNPASTIYSKVLEIKTTANSNWIRLDASIYSGLIDSYIEMKKFPIYDDAIHSKLYHISGFTADTCDYLGEFELSNKLSVGDIVKIDECGAYCIDMSSNYSGVPTIEVEIIK